MKDHGIELGGLNQTEGISASGPAQYIWAFEFSELTCQLSVKTRMARWQILSSGQIQPDDNGSTVLDIDS